MNRPEDAPDLPPEPAPGTPSAFSQPVAEALQIAGQLVSSPGAAGQTAPVPAVNAPVPEPQVPMVGGAGTAAPTVPAGRCRVLVVDDELVGLTAAHFRDSAAAFVAELEDLTSPTAEQAWAVVAKLKGKKAFDATDPQDIAAYFASDDFVRDVVFSPEFRAAGVPGAEGLTGFYERAQVVQDLRTMLETAYPAPHFELLFVASRPMPAGDLMAYDLVILDLVLLNSAGAVDELVRYLTDLGSATYPAQLPCLIVLSSREEMVENRLRFSTESHISAAGLLLLEKGNVRHVQFGAPGLVLAYQQLGRQRHAAQYMRVFVKEWMTALERAKAAASETLWNLDAAAMQEIHLSAISDDDPYDEHLNELVAREYLYHVETSADVSRAIEALDKCFQSQLQTLNKKVSIGERFMAPFVDSKPGRTIVSHFNWTGFTVTGPLDQVPTSDMVTRFNRLVPFGAVLAPPQLAAGSECWVHITQQCDLNSAVRGKKDGDVASDVSAMFAVATAMEVNDRTVPVHDTNQLVARGLRVGTHEFDLKLLDGRLISLPISQLIKAATDQKMEVVGRLRHDIANQFLNATANHMTRPAQLKATRVEVRPGRVFLWGTGLPDGTPLAFLDTDGRAPRTVMVSQHNKLHYFQDEASMRLALWIAEQLNVHFAKPGLDAAKICNTLRVGLPKGGNVISVLNLTVEVRAFDQVDGFWREKSAPPGNPLLYVFQEPSTSL